MKIWTRAISILITLVIIYVAVTQLDWTRLAETFVKADLTFLGYALGIWGILMAIKGIKWQQLVAAVNGKIGFFESIRLLLIGLFISIATPGRLGDFARAFYIKDRVPLGKGIMAVLIDRAMDVLVLMGFAILGLLLLAQTQGVEIFSPWMAVLLFVAAIAATFMVLKRSWARWVWQRVQGFLPEGYRSLLQRHGAEFYDAIPLFKKNFRNVIIAAFCTVASWICSITFGWFIMLSLHYPLGWNAALIATPIFALVEIIPAGILGLGTREVASVILLGAYGISPENAVAFSLLFFALGYIPSFLLGALFFNRSPVRVNMQDLLSKKETK
ncbi:MAG: flippase-like domain-containing protein [Candidatus Iainarchaeum archaeon]|uniref:Flippase-like domain-containing protein n=1 Tax=Candidatus Iainarchaeum sp. TaxID=3101447 RepID=A0A7T9I171_9ARCH|nr:MAG: flippase-like domain-containing protein [Candidatus Diapherotrites archaeon]